MSWGFIPVLGAMRRSQGVVGLKLTAFNLQAARAFGKRGRGRGCVTQSWELFPPLGIGLLRNGEFVGK